MIFIFLVNIKRLPRVIHRKESLLDMIVHLRNFIQKLGFLYQKNFISAISHYKRAEEKLEYVEDDIEKAEFLYKIFSA
jgi:hypothetical protein